jgi:hypothetical protein
MAQRGMSKYKSDKDKIRNIDWWSEQGCFITNARVLLKPQEYAL